MAEIKLEYPVESNGVTIELLSMRRPKVRDQIAAQKGDKPFPEIEKTLFSNLCEVAPAVIEELDMKDYKKLQNTYSGFLE